MTDSVYQRVRGFGIELLAPELRPYFTGRGVGVGRGVFEVAGSPTDDGGLSAVRTFHLPGRDRPLEDTMRVVDGRLHDFLGKRRGFEVQMELTITDGLLELRSGRAWLHLGRARIPLPPFATVTVSESWADGRQHVDVRIVSPVLGEWFRYAGSFSYRYAAP